VLSGKEDSWLPAEDKQGQRQGEGKTNQTRRNPLTTCPEEKSTGELVIRNDQLEGGKRSALPQERGKKRGLEGGGERTQIEKKRRRSILPSRSKAHSLRGTKQTKHRVRPPHKKMNGGQERGRNRQRQECSSNAIRPY